jgi:hypothetical protein
MDVFRLLHTGKMGNMQLQDYLLVEVIIVKVLVVHSSRINQNDGFADAIAIRALFAAWDRSEIAQVYSSNHNCDAGAFFSYYELSEVDFFFGKMKMLLKRSQGESEGSAKINRITLGVGSSDLF